jgi:hypothetical protein
MLPVPACTFSEKVKTRFAVGETPVASSGGVEEDSVGAVVSAAAAVVKFSVVAPDMPAKLFPARSLMTPAAISM